MISRVNELHLFDVLSRHGRLTTVIAPDAESARVAALEALQQPGRELALSAWNNGGRQVKKREGVADDRR